MKLNPIVAHLRATCPSFAQRISGGIDWDAVVESAKLALPAAYVIASADVATPSKAQNVTVQDITDQFSVVIVLEPTDERGQDANDLLHDLRAELWRALVGFKPDSDYSAIVYDGGEMVSINSSRAFYRLRFFAEFQLGRNLPSQPAESWHERELDGLSSFTGATVRVDAIDPADPNLKRPGPDGRVEMTFSGDVTP